MGCELAPSVVLNLVTTVFISLIAMNCVVPMMMTQALPHFPASIGASSLMRAITIPCYGLWYIFTVFTHASIIAKMVLVLIDACTGASWIGYERVKYHKICY